MLEQKIRDVLLVDELQLDCRLNNAVSSGDRADFALLLSMISQDVCDAPQFCDQVSATQNDNLRSRFELQKPQEQFSKAEDFDRASALSELLHQGSINDVFLSNCLKPEPLCEYERVLAPEVYSELTPLLQEKFNALKDGADKGLAHVPLSLKGNGFEILDEVDNKSAQNTERLEEVLA